VIPVEVTQTPWHYTTWPDALDHWQTFIAGLLALGAAFHTIRQTRRIADRQIEASGEDARKVIAATREQIEATFRQTETTENLERKRDASEATAFAAMVEAAMSRVLDEAAWAKRTYPNILTQEMGSSAEAFVVRHCITKGAFPELRAACVRRGGLLTFNILDLEREIDSFALQCEDTVVNAGVIVRWGKHAGLGRQLGVIEKMAKDLHLKSSDQ
jgi:hypothetical protein